MQHDPKGVAPRGDSFGKCAGKRLVSSFSLGLAMACWASLAQAGEAQEPRKAGTSHAAKVATGQHITGQHPTGKSAYAKPVTGGKVNAALAAAEQAVAAHPRDAAARAALGRVYLREGRFLSAATALNDAVTLGDTGNRTMLALALAQVGSGQDGAALATLEQGKNTIPVVDLGLALALAGEPARGAAMLAEAVKAGDGSEKLRANLAYSYALAGDWAQARSLISTDLPADRVDARMTEWAAKAKPEASQERVASLLGLTIKSDTGMPARLALAPAKLEAPALAAVESAVTAPALAVNSAEAVVEAPSLPAPAASSASVESFRVITASTTPVAAVTDKMVQTPASVSLAAAKTAEHSAEPKGKASKPEAKLAARAAMPSKSSAPRATKPLKAGQHGVQLGAFVSETNAQMARDAAMKRDKSLAGRVTITKANVNGRDFWRVTVAGLDAASASGKCDAIRKAGGACFAYGAASVASMRMAAAPKLVTPILGKSVTPAKVAAQVKPVGTQQNAAKPVAAKPVADKLAAATRAENISPRSTALAMAVKARLTR